MSAPSRTSCVADGDSMGIRSSETPATAANSNSAHPMAVAGPRTRTAEDQVGSRSDMRYGARTSHALITWMDHRDMPYLHGGLKGNVPGGGRRRRRRRIVAHTVEAKRSGSPVVEESGSQARWLRREAWPALRCWTP